MTSMTPEERRMEKIESKLDTINETLKTIAVQDQRLKTLETDIYGMKEYQKTCPRQQVKIQWFLVLPMGAALLGAAYKMIMG